MELNVTINVDDIVEELSAKFDYAFTGTSTFKLPELTVPTEDFNIGLIIGRSGSGKTQLLKHKFGYESVDVNWEPSKAIISHWPDLTTALDKLFAAGLASIPTLCRPYHVLSTGQQYRAMVARQLGNKAIFDEFTSTVNRSVAKSLSNSIGNYVRNNDLKGIVIASCHTDIIEWLMPDWVFDCDSGLVVEQAQDDHKRVAHIEIY